ncbi:MAG: hypothetical protein KBE22_00195 [Candidatus Accumulibacter sp.]|nr:hypothetical protein [Accumulibacter sp.]
MQSQTIAYVGHREQHKDVTYGTGEWVKGQVKAVPLAVAPKMLRHPDVYQPAEADDTADVVSIPVADDESAKESAVQEAIDAVQTMGVEALKTFAEQNFNVKFDGRKSAEKLRLDAQQLIHRFGMPG